MKKIILLLAVILACGTAWSNPGGKHPKHNNELKFISFNIRLGSSWSKNQDGPNFWDNRKESVVKMILQEQPDAIGMQEVLPNQLAYLDSALTGYQRIGVGRDDGKSEGEHMAIFLRKDRIKLKKWHTYWLSTTPDSVSMGWDAGCHRTVTMALIKDKQTHRKMLYMNTHLDHQGMTARAESTKLLARLADEWTGKTLPVIIGGDMNTSERDTIFNSLTSNGFVLARDTAPITDTACTYTGFGKDTPKRIDHFFGRGLKIKEFHTLNGNYGVPYISDHYPVVVIFEEE